MRITSYKSIRFNSVESPAFMEASINLIAFFQSSFLDIQLMKKKKNIFFNRFLGLMIQFFHIIPTKKQTFNSFRAQLIKSIVISKKQIKLNWRKQKLKIKMTKEWFVNFPKVRVVSNLWYVNHFTKKICFWPKGNKLNPSNKSS